MTAVRAEELSGDISNLGGYRLGGGMCHNRTALNINLCISTDIDNLVLAGLLSSAYTNLSSCFA